MLRHALLALFLGVVNGFVDHMFFIIQPDMALMEDVGICDEISILEEKYQGQVFDTIAKALNFLYCVHFELPILLRLVSYIH